MSADNYGIVRFNIDNPNPWCLYQGWASSEPGNERLIQSFRTKQEVQTFLHGSEPYYFEYGCQWDVSIPDAYHEFYGGMDINGNSRRFCVFYKDYEVVDVKHPDYCGVIKHHCKDMGRIDVGFKEWKVLQEMYCNDAKRSKENNQ